MKTVLSTIKKFVREQLLTISMIETIPVHSRKKKYLLHINTFPLDQLHKLRKEQYCVHLNVKEILRTSYGMIHLGKLVIILSAFQ